MKETERWKVRWREKMKRRQKGGREGRREGRQNKKQRKSQASQPQHERHSGLDHSVVGAVLCVVGRATAALGSTHRVPVVSPSPNRFQTSPDVPRLRGKIIPAPRTSDLEGHRNGH